MNDTLTAHLPHLNPDNTKIIIDKANEIFAIGDHAEGNILQAGQMIP